MTDLFICFKKNTSLDFLKGNKEHIKKYVIHSNNSSSSSLKNIIEEKTADTYISTLERLFAVDFITGSLPLTAVFKNDNPDSFIQKRHQLYDKTSNSKSNNVQPALRKFFDWIKFGDFVSCDCSECKVFLDKICKRIVKTNSVCKNCLCGDILHCGERFGCHRNVNGVNVCFGVKKCYNCDFYFPLCSFSNMFENVTQEYELENIITGQLNLCNKCNIKTNVKTNWGYQKNASTLHNSYYHGAEKMARPKRKLYMELPKNKEVSVVATNTEKAPHKKTASFVESYYNNLKQCLQWVKEQKQSLENNYVKYVKGIESKIDLQKRLDAHETNTIRKIISTYEVTDSSFVQFIDRKQYVLIPKKNERIQLKEKKKHTIILKKTHKGGIYNYFCCKRTSKKRKRSTELNFKKTAWTYRKNQVALEKFGFGPKKKKKTIPKHRRSQVRRITDNFEMKY